MNVLSWLDFSRAPPGPGATTLLLAAVTLAVGAMLVLAAQRRGKREAGTVRHFKSPRRRGAL
jgi:hypothetical protein